MTFSYATQQSKAKPTPNQNSRSPTSSAHKHPWGGGTIRPSQAVHVCLVSAAAAGTVHSIHKHCLQPQDFAHSQQGQNRTAPFSQATQCRGMLRALASSKALMLRCARTSLQQIEHSSVPTRSLARHFTVQQCMCKAPSCRKPGCSSSTAHSSWRHWQVCCRRHRPGCRRRRGWPWLGDPSRDQDCHWCQPG